ncbi:transferrin-binding protein-like solute binding protein [Pasteurella atlantica]|uniref:Transferrin-binding protein-like solute binding protein n=2 Tax=Pasteurellaceae TaxID=712 RepID=A0ACC6HMC5_9PAST|nr:transferrin-binding protein-like solute binding protein [Pasteurella atlantica]MDP8032789.1 transferrin-binding protein-like solute binding protein [Pasteurella atlantica]MDP8034705.1 transferrin-binding protein-like solute binding protein [Pasteurella atlantica]MDP8036655.1 transferrin-binding protein-like solute binding protein [Pasteurella atlantica]MDP8047023.1 transferrin-binding protein-like solute binding protein [Pasteurella atlantica]MDP8048976.1 transferrin-binding protein-like so
MKKLVLVTAISLVLTACGSSGGGNSGSADNIKSAKVEGVLFAYDLQNPVKKQSKDPAGDITEYDDYELKMTRLSKDKDINHIQINSVSIQLEPNGDEKYTDYYDETGMDTVKVGQVLRSVTSGNTYKYMRFGQHSTYDYDPNNPADHNDDQQTFGIFVQGYATQNMPTADAGIVTYTGDAYGGTEALTKGKSKIDVNFGNKTLKGTLSDWQNYKFLAEEDKAQPIHFSANIKGNKFEGQNVKGNFFGDNAAEVGGIYYNKQKKEGAIFGAKRP